MAITRASEWKDSSEEWLIEGLVCDSLTLISGEPKAGKSALAVHLVRSLLNGDEILGKQVLRQVKNIGWMGFDLKWQRELTERAPDLIECLLFVDPIHYKDCDAWNQLFKDLRESDIDILVIDHLYGLGAGAELDKQHSAQEALEPIKEIVKRFDIPVLLLTQAGKSATGRAAHSVALEGFARWMIRISGSGSVKRKLELIGNNGATEKIDVCLNPNELSMLTKVEREKVSRKREVNLPERARTILERASTADLKNATELGKWVALQGWGINSPQSGRALINQLLETDLLSREDSNSPITIGSKLVT